MLDNIQQNHVVKKDSLFQGILGNYIKTAGVTVPQSFSSVDINPVETTPSVQFPFPLVSLFWTHPKVCSKPFGTIGKAKNPFNFFRPKEQWCPLRLRARFKVQACATYLRKSGIFKSENSHFTVHYCIVRHNANFRIAFRKSFSNKKVNPSILHIVLRKLIQKS